MKYKEPRNINVISIQVTPAILNSEKKATENSMSHIKHIIIAESCLGICRLYLLNSRRLIQWTNFVLSATLSFLIIYYTLPNNFNKPSYIFVRGTSCVEYLLLVISSLIMNKSSFKNFFKDLSTFDASMSISDWLHVINPIYRQWLWMVLSLIYIVLEYILIAMYIPTAMDNSFNWNYLSLMAHDIEQLLFCSLLRMIMMRVYLLKACIVKTFLPDNSTEKQLSGIEVLTRNAQFDISSLHRNYELLHKCAEQLNSIMSFPMMLMLFCSGLSTTVLLRSIFKALQMSDDSTKKAIIIYCISRCVKYTALLLIPCYFSSVTTTQIAHIRTILHDALNSTETDKVRRRRVKAFFQLTRENEFAYALWGVIRLNMSLPLSYLSLCTTYLVIIIQFSKFID